MDNESALAGVAHNGNHSFVVKLTSGRSFELSFEQLLAHTMRLQDKRGAPAVQKQSSTVAT